MVVKIAFVSDVMYSELIVSKKRGMNAQFETLASISNSVVTLPKETQERLNISPNKLPDGYDSWENFFDDYKEAHKAMEKL